MQGAEDLLTGFWRELVEKIDDLRDDFLFELCGISEVWRLRDACDARERKRS